MHFSKNGGGRRGKKRVELDQNERYINKKNNNNKNNKINK
jgi:hypothetical protein